MARLSRASYVDLKSAFRALRERNGTQTFIVRNAVTRGGQSDFSRWESTNDEHLGEDKGSISRFAPLDVVADLEDACGEPIVTKELAELAGCTLVRLPPTLRGNAPLARVTGAAMREAGEVFARLGKALDDGHIDRAEDLGIESEIDAAIGKLLELKFQVRAEAGK